MGSISSGTERRAPSTGNTTVSVIIPVYNVEKYLERCVDSVLSQSWPDIEIILVDDGSADSCGRICDEYARRYGNIKAVHQKNRGLGAARNAGLAMASGEYIGFVDSDDWIEKDMYQRLLEACIESGAGIASCDLMHELLDGSRSAEETPGGTYTASEVFQNILSVRKMSYSSCNKLFSRAAIAGSRFPEGVISEDVVFVTDCIERAGKLVHLQEPFYHYCQRDGSLTESPYTSKMLTSFKQREIFRRLIKKKHPELLQAMNAQLHIYAGWVIGGALNRRADRKSLLRLYLYCLKYTRGGYDCPEETAEAFKRRMDELLRCVKYGYAGRNGA